jgi:hypothetical protein
MHISHSDVCKLATSRNFSFDGPGTRLDGYDFYIRLVNAEGRRMLRCAMMSNDIGDVCRFLGRDGVTGYDGRRPGRKVDSVRLVRDGLGGVNHVLGPVPLIAY